MKFYKFQLIFTCGEKPFHWFNVDSEKYGNDTTLILNRFKTFKLIFQNRF